MPALDNLSRVADVSYTIARRAGSLAVSVVRLVADMASERRSQSRTRTPTTPASGAPSSATPRQAPPPAPAPGRAQSPDPAAAGAPVPTPAAAAEPVASEPDGPADDHVSREAVLVAESADAGAEDGAGPQIRIGEPWEGYGKLTAKEVNDRLAVASPESLAIARMYEAAHRNRITVLREIDRRLAAAGS